MSGSPRILSYFKIPPSPVFGTVPEVPPSPSLTPMPTASSTPPAPPSFLLKSIFLQVRGKQQMGHGLFSTSSFHKQQIADLDLANIWIPFFFFFPPHPFFFASFHPHPFLQHSGLWGSTKIWNLILDILMKEIRHPGTWEAHGWMGCLAPLTAPIVASTEPEPCRHWATRRKPRRYVSTAMGTATSRGLCTLCPLTVFAASTPCWLTWHDLCLTTSTCLRECVTFTPLMDPGKSEAWMNWKKVIQGVGGGP